ncbi:MAG: hypothetical protein OEL66_04650 [Desulfobulbaceae bacterium]|nr:hypothetical protein [Desulfobulbaceae bacterium]
MKGKILLLLLTLLLPTMAHAAPVDFTFTGVDGTVYTGEQLRGRPVVLHFGSHW